MTTNQFANAIYDAIALNQPAETTDMVLVGPLEDEAGNEVGRIIEITIGSQLFELAIQELKETN